MREGGMFSAIIFDMDGVIADSEPLHIKAERMTFSPFELDISDEEFQAYMGRTPKILLQGIIEKYGLETTADELYPVHKQHLLALYQNEVEPISGALDTVRSFSKMVPAVGLASSSDVALIASVLDRFGLREYFDCTVSGEQVENIKPHPEIFLTAAEQLMVSPEHCLVIEDSTAGIEAAKAAGMACIGFRSPNSHNQEYDKADLTADTFTEIDYDTLKVLWEARKYCGQ